MTYQRYAFRDPVVRLDNVKIPYSSGEAVIPVFDYPITPFLRGSCGGVAVCVRCVALGALGGCR